jgi:hypothetical protein
MFGISTFRDTYFVTARPFVTGCDTSRWDHVTGESSTPLLLLLPKPLSVNEAAFFHVYEVEVPFVYLIYFMIPRRNCIA